MKMKFIPLLFVLGLMSANAQITTTTGAKVFVSSGTLVYSTGDVTVNTGTEKFKNNGNLKIATGTLRGTADYDAFELGYTAQDDYGQLIIKSEKPATGRMSINWLNPTTGAYNATTLENRNIYFGTPFVGYEYKQFAQDVTGDVNEPDLETPCGFERCFNAGPYGRHAIFEWNNDKFRYDPVDKNSEDGTRTFIPGKFYTIRKDRLKNQAAFTGTDANGVIRLYKGTPYVAVAAPTIAFPELDYATTIIGNNALNLYKVSYSTYLSDPFIDASQLQVYNKYTTNDALKAVNYANRLLQLINPYTSNIDLKAVTNGFQNIQGVGSYGITTRPGKAAERYAGKSQTASVSNGNLVGDNLRFIPPMTNFFIKASTSGVSINLLGTPASTAEADQIQTFEKTTYKAGDATDTPTASRMAAKSTSDESSIFQLRLNIMSEDKNSIYNYTYVAASSNFVTGENTEVEVAENDIASTEIGVYTLPEAKTGGLDPNISTESRLRINAINTAAKVAIPVGVNVPSSAEATSFVFTANLTENQKLVPTKFDDPNAKFYFHDKGEDGNQNIVIEIDADFAYPVTITQTTNDRFELFWKEASTLGNEDIQTLESLTTVYKTGSDYKVKFDTNWKKADVSVFNILGQLISSEKNINTQNDYLLPIYNASSTMYIIKIVNEKGEVVTKKIVK